MRVKNKFFPEEYRAFCNGELSICVERFGGINSVNLLDKYESGGKIFPDRFALPLFSRNGFSGGRPLFSSPIRFFSVDRQMREIPFCPANAELFPDGFISKNYSIFLDNDSFGVHLVPEIQNKAVFAVISKYHFFTGELESLKNQLAKPYNAIQWMDDCYRGDSFDRGFPFEDTTQKISRAEVVFKDNFLIIKWDLEYNYCCKKLYMAVSADRKITFSQDQYFYKLEVPGAAAETAFGFGIAETENQTKKNAGKFTGSFSAVKRRKKQRKFPRSVKIKVDSIPFAAEFAAMFPHYQSAMLMAETSGEVTSRAATDKFGYFAMWDQIYPARDFLLAGLPEITLKSLRYMFFYPHAKSCMWVTFHLVITLNEYLAFTGNRKFLREVKSLLIEFFQFSSLFTDKKSGLVKDTLVYGVDVSRELGLEGFFYASCVNSWHYCYCRSLENMFRYLKLDHLAEKCRENAGKIEKSYEKVFMDQKTGYLRSAVDANFNVPEVEIFQNVNTIGLDYIHGVYLFRNIVKKLAAYQATKLYHPLGHTAVAADSLIPCDMWRATHMNQHNGHECKVARLGGRPAEALRVMQGFMNRAEEYQTAIETFNLSGFPGNCVQTANWQTFAATAAVQGMLCGIIGVNYHQGGINYVPAEFTGRHEASNLHFRNRIYSFKVSGKGDFARISINGRRLKYSLQIPEDWSDEKIFDCSVRHTVKLPDHPVLLCAIDLPVCRLNGSGSKLCFQAGDNIHAPVKVYSPRCPVIMVAGKRVTLEWNDTENIAWFDHIFKKGDWVEIRLN